jgi:hypothetical protein
MASERQFVSTIVSCPYGHQIRLETLSDTPNMVGAIECPVCGIGTAVFSGDIRGVVPVGVDSNSGHESRHAS